VHRHERKLYGAVDVDGEGRIKGEQGQDRSDGQHRNGRVPAGRTGARGTAMRTSFIGVSLIGTDTVSAARGYRNAIRTWVSRPAPPLRVACASKIRPSANVPRATKTVSGTWAACVGCRVSV
jgi:hypothetical protein